ncbi:MAG TPA: D-aminoacyl-tRNA deacylase [candidate division Zixibacteria bacterium]|nr:D-aminoacyl-tRNA deacylase [candidate division Zixibacteria bacterium]
MRAVIQRVRSASVTIDGEVVGRIGRGLLVLLGACQGDGEADLVYLAEKIPNLRIFEDENAKMNRSLLDLAAEGEAGMLVVSQFTLYADSRKGRRPSFTLALEPGAAEALYDRFVARLRALGLKTETGGFGAKMLVALENDGPVTIIIDSPGHTADAPAAGQPCA